MIVRVPNRISQIHEASIHGRRLQAELGADLRDARLARGLRQIDVARATDVSDARISRVERGRLRGLAIAELARHAAAVGLKLHARFYPNAGGLRDAAQLDLLRRLRARIGDTYTWLLEAPLPIPGDQRAFDALLTQPGNPTTVAIEAITRLRDAQAQLRAATRKQRDGNATRLVILLRASHANRTALATAADVLATTFPLATRATLAALSAGEDPGENGIVLL
jgi:transcriptional regulator with XRE-family HTH domain